MPLKSAKLAGLPSASVKETSGAGCGGVCGINSPIRIFPSSAAGADDSVSRSTIAAVPNDAKHRGGTDINTMWGGRFAGGPAAIMRRINASIDFDKRLYAEDIAGSEAHCAMLVAQAHHLAGRWRGDRSAV